MPRQLLAVGVLAVFTMFLRSPQVSHGDDSSETNTNEHVAMARHKPILSIWNHFPTHSDQIFQNSLKLQPGGIHNVPKAFFEQKCSFLLAIHTVFAKSMRFA